MTQSGRLASCLGFAFGRAPLRPSVLRTAAVRAGRLAWMILLVVVLTTAAGLAQGTATLGDPTGAEPRWRSAEAAPRGVQGGDMSMVTAAQTMAQEFRLRLRQRVDAIPLIYRESRAVLAANSPTGTAGYFLWLVPWTLSFLIFGHAVAWGLFQRPVVRPWMRRLIRPDPQGLGEKLPYLTLRLVVGILMLALSMIAGFALGAATFNAPENAMAEKTVVIVFGAWAASYALVLLWRMILAPSLPQYRLTAFADADARRLFGWLSVGSVLSVAAHAYCTWMYELGLSDDVHAVVVSGLTLVSVIVTIATILANRVPVAKALVGGLALPDATGPARLVAGIWAPAAIGYAIVTWLEMTYRLIMGTAPGVPPILGAYLIVGTMAAVHGLVLFAIERFFSRRRMRARVGGLSGSDQQTAAGDGGEGLQAAGRAGARPRIETYEDLAARVSGVLAMIAGCWALLSVWDLRSVPLIDAVLTQGFDLFVVLLLSYVAYQAARIAIDERIASEGGADFVLERGDEGSGKGASRLATLLPLVRSGILAVIVMVGAAMVFLQLGVNLAPLFAGAGVIGIAIGFGAQYLIRDVFAGAFFLVDDAFRRGEYIDVGSVKGTVENISIRSFQLRHHLGPLHTIPFGEIKTLTNYSRDWVIMKLPLRVTYDTDVEKVRKLVKALGQELLSDPVIGDQFLQPLKSQGVIEMQDSAMIIRVKFMTKPGDQWMIRQRVYGEIRELFLREGIKFAHREVTVRVADGAPPLTQAQREAVMAAAIDLDAMPDMPGMPKPAAAAG